MSFLHILKVIGHELDVAVMDAAPFEPLIAKVPSFGPMAATALGAVIAVEKLIPGSLMGSAKKTAALAIVSGAHPHAPLSAAASGPDAERLIEAIVLALNTFAGELAKLDAPAAAVK